MHFGIPNSKFSNRTQDMMEIQETQNLNILFFKLCDFAIEMEMVMDFWMFAIATMKNPKLNSKLFSEIIYGFVI